MAFGSPVLVLLAIPFLLAVVVATVAGTRYVSKKGITRRRWLPVVGIAIFLGSFMLALSALQGLAAAMDRAGASKFTGVPHELVAVTSCGAEKLGEPNARGRQRYELTFTIQLDPVLVRLATRGKLDKANRILVAVEHSFDEPAGRDSYTSTGGTTLGLGESDQTIVIRKEQETTADDRDHYNESPTCEVTTAFLIEE